MDAATADLASMGGLTDPVDFAELAALLQKTSRTFALTIPLLPVPTRMEVGVAYLLFRIIDTFEDATTWTPGRRVEALAEFVELLDVTDGKRTASTASRWVRDPPVAHAGYVDLLKETPRVLAWCSRLAPAAAEQMRRHVARSASGMADFVRRTDGNGLLQLQTLQELRDYCFVVAGIVGEMLTELFLIGDPGLAGVAAELRVRAGRFGEALQLVNILKDARSDAAEGRQYLPRQVALPEVFMLARRDLEAATEYTEILQASGAGRGLVAFNALNTRLAIATLRLLRERGPASKLTRLQVTGLAADVMHAVETRGKLFPERP